MPSLSAIRFQALSLVCALWIAPAALAVVIDTGDGTGNTTSPGDDFGFDNVGVTDTNLGGVYLGDGWVLTANHVKDKPIAFLGTTYSPVPDSGVRLENLSAPHPDLYVYRINGFPNLPPIVLSSATPAINDELTCLGNGWNREAGATSWNALWQESTEPGALPPFIFDGYKRGIGRTQRWGRNEVTDVDDVDIENQQGTVVSTTRSLITVFDETGGSVDEAQAASGDSGGGCFAKRSGTWELVGLMFAMSSFQGQPNQTVVFGNETLVADIFFYKDQIEALTPPIGAVPAMSLVGSAVLGLLIVGVAHRFQQPRR